MESLQLAQMLADLSDLNAAEPDAAAALVTANKAIAQVQAHQAHANVVSDQGGLKVPEQRHHQRVASASAVVSRTGSPARIDNLSRRLLTPPITRSNSTQGSTPGTPRREAEPEGDIDRASTLMALYDIRAKLKQQDNSSMVKAREKIAALAAKQQAQMSSTERHQATPAKLYTFPRGPGTTH